ncbi:MAG: agmatinase family protein [Clostridia bacterium]|nr:agmatinase family protein [Clostridia bacterium]
MGEERRPEGGRFRDELSGREAVEREGRLGASRAADSVRRALELGLPAAESVQDRTIPTFSRGELPHFAGINTFLKVPYLEDVRRVGEHDVAVLGVPLDTGTTYRSGTRFGPQAIRRVSALYTPYNFEMGVDLSEALDIVDLGDVHVIPANIEKSFDQIARAVGHVFRSGALPILFGGDHSIGYPCVRGIAENFEGRIGIIHLDRHVDTQERDLDERMHTTPWFHATNIPNAPPTNLVQIGIGGWQVPRPGVRVARERGTTVLTVRDVVEVMGIEKAAEVALEVAWKGASAVYLSFDIDSVDCGFVPGTGWPEPGGFLPREALQLLRLVAREGICAMEVVEVSPPYDVSDTTALLAVRAVLDVLATLVNAGHLPRRRAAGRVAL